MLAAVLLLSSAVGAQAPVSPSSRTPISLRPLFDMIRRQSPEHRAIYDLTFRRHERMPLTAAQVWSRLASATPPGDATDQAAADFAVAYREALEQTFARMSGTFISTDPHLPLLVGEHRQRTAVVLVGQVHDEVFNTQRTTARRRAVDMARALPLSVLRRAAPLCNLSDIGFVGSEVL